MFNNVEAFYRPRNVPEALRLLQGARGKARILAGGTDLAVTREQSVRFLIDLSRAGLTYVRRRGLAWAIGATTTLAELEDSSGIRRLAGGLLSRAAATCGSIQIRNMATLGGNLANGSPAADMVTPLLALDASVVLGDGRGRHKLALPDYLGGIFHKKFPESLLIEVLIPEPARMRHCGWSFRKFGRTEVDISIVNVAAGLQLNGNKRVKSARIALGAVSPVPIRAVSAEQLMTGRVLDQALVADAASEVERLVRPITDQRASATYRRELIRVLTGRAIEECAALAGCPA
jgi:probable selenate reductase FAD-binding subunit